MQTLLQMQNISKEFPGVKALNQVSFSLKQGEILGLCGENGAGKSTLMKILSGSYSCETYSGGIHLNGERKQFYTPKDAENAGIAMIYQEISLHQDLNAIENLLLGSLPHRFGRINWKKARNIAVDILERVDLKIAPFQPIRHLSISQQQLLAIGRSLLKKPKILVLDEPTSALTEKEANNLHHILQQEIKNNGLSCVYISHKLEDVFSICDRITVLRDGEVVDTIAKKDYQPEKIISMMIGRSFDAVFPPFNAEKGEEVLRVENLQVRHPENPDQLIVEKASFTLHKGEILGIAGLIGSGRSELVNAVFGALPSTGKIYLHGKEAVIRSPKDAIAHGIGLVTEDRRATGLVVEHTVRENASLASLKDISLRFRVLRAKENDRVLNYKDKLKIKTKDIEVKVGTLSGGNQQKVVLAKWLLAGTNIFIFDEPTRGIDVGAKYEIYQLMLEILRGGGAIIMISSELPELIGMSSRIIVLSKGVISAELPDIQQHPRSEVTNKILKAVNDL